MTRDGEAVKSMMLDICSHIIERRLDVAHEMYETLIRDYCNCNSHWPSPWEVSHYFEDCLFLYMYTQIWYRHLFATSSPTLDQMIHCWENYCLLFQDLLYRLSTVPLPHQWLWDILDEFVNQFHSFSQYRTCYVNSEDYITRMKHCHDAWSVYQVFRCLQAMVDRASTAEEDLKLQLSTPTKNGTNVFNVLGYFSMIGLLRVHCLLGNYQTGLDCLHRIDIRQNGFYTTLITCHVTTIYHYGFANVMTGRYVDAVHVFNGILLYLFKTEQSWQNSPWCKQIQDKINQMYALLAICLSLCPSQLQSIDEHVNSQLMEKHGRDIPTMQRRDDESSDLCGQLLLGAWPAFGLPFDPSSGDLREVLTKEELACYDDEDLAIAYPDFFGPSAERFVVPRSDDTELTAVVARMLKFKPE